MRTVAVYRPGRAFPSISVTGDRCELLCEHCRGKYLKGMTPTVSPDELISLAHRIHSEGGTGLLLSGGCDRRGRVPLLPFLPAVREIKNRTALLVNLHPGMVDEEEAQAIAASGADRISFDLVLDEDVLLERMHLDRGPEDNLASFRHLVRAAPGRVTPHVLLGAGREERELEAVREACGENVPCIILLSLLGEKVPDWEGRLLRAVQEGVRGRRPMLLGCMRPRGRPEVEVAAIEAGAMGIANPSPQAVELFRGKGWTVQERRTCCALHR